MNVFNKVTLESLKKNRTRTIVTIIGIMLSAAMICASTTLVSSMQNFVLRCAIHIDGDWYGAVYDAAYKDYEDIRDSDRVSSAAYAQVLGYAKIDSANERKPYLYVLGGDVASGYFNENKLKMKDIATIGIFSALLFVVTMVAGALMGISMVLNMYSVAVVAVLSAPLYMLIMAKVHKKGAVLLTFAIVGILWGLFGGIFVLIWMLGFGVVGEVLASKSKYQNYKMLTVSFGLYSVGYYLGAIAPLYYYPAFWYGFDRPKETVDAMIAAAHSTTGLAAIPVTLIAIVIGAVIAKRMLKKHFEKAGVI